MASITPQSGRVIRFDNTAGYGWLRSKNDEEHLFHCTSIVDGSRTIAVDTPVYFRVVARRNGEWQATDLVPAPSS